jgi:hypothetical protein
MKNIHDIIVDLRPQPTRHVKRIKHFTRSASYRTKTLANKEAYRHVVTPVSLATSSITTTLDESNMEEIRGVLAHLRVQNEPRVDIGLLFGRSGCIGWAKKDFLFVCMQLSPNLDGDDIRPVWYHSARPKVTSSIRRVALPCSHLSSHRNHSS